MKLYISLFGSKRGTCGWFELLNQEKTPFRYRGSALGLFSQVNILTGFREIPSGVYDRNEFFVIEPPLDDSNIGATIVNLRNVSVIRKRNVFELNSNISLQLINNPVNRAEILKFLKEILVDAFSRADLPYIHVWYYPNTSPTAFLFRQDVDYVDKKGMENLKIQTSKFGIRGSYFVNISGEEEFDEIIGHCALQNPITPKRKEVLSELQRENNEISNHGYWHLIFGDFRRNYDNIKKCNFYLKRLFGVKKTGFASPGGEWNDKLFAAIDGNKMAYSCNGLSNGGFPYHPYIGSEGKRAVTLEIPFYFSSDASYKNIALSKNQKKLADYFLELIKNNLETNEPIGITGHPHLMGKISKKFYLRIFKKIRLSKIPNYTAGEFAIWWKKREGIKISCEKKGNFYTIRTNKSNKYNFIVNVAQKRNKYSASWKLNSAEDQINQKNGNFIHCRGRYHKIHRTAD